MNRVGEEHNIPGEWPISEQEFMKESAGGFRTDAIDRFSATGVALGPLAARLNAVPKWMREKLLRGSLAVDAALSDEFLKGVPALTYVTGGKALGFGSVFHKSPDD